MNYVFKRRMRIPFFVFIVCLILLGSYGALFKYTALFVPRSAPLLIRLFWLAGFLLIAVWESFRGFLWWRKRDIPILELGSEGVRYDEGFIAWEDISSVELIMLHGRRSGLLNYALRIMLNKKSSVDIELRNIVASPTELREAFEHYKPIKLSRWEAFYFDFFYPWRFILFFALVAMIVLIYWFAIGFPK